VCASLQEGFLLLGEISNFYQVYYWLYLCQKNTVGSFILFSRSKKFFRFPPQHPQNIASSHFISLS